MNMEYPMSLVIDFLNQKLVELNIDISKYESLEIDTSNLKEKLNAYTRGYNKIRALSTLKASTDIFVQLDLEDMEYDFWEWVVANEDRVLEYLKGNKGIRKWLLF